MQSTLDIGKFRVIIALRRARKRKASEFPQYRNGHKKATGFVPFPNEKFVKGEKHMTIVQFINFLHGCGLDVLALGLLDSLLTSLVKKLSQKLKRNAPKTYLTAVPFLLGTLLFSLWFLIAFPCVRPFFGNAALIAQRGFFVGVAATLFGTFPRAFFPRRAKRDERGEGGELPTLRETDTRQRAGGNSSDGF